MLQGFFRNPNHLLVAVLMAIPVKLGWLAQMRDLDRRGNVDLFQPIYHDAFAGGCVVLIMCERS